jgi:hypothetical protein
MADKNDPVDDEIELDPPEGVESDAVDQQVVDEEADDQVPEGDEVDGEERQPDQVDAGAQRPSRGESRHQALANELREARQREADLNRRLDQVLAVRPAPAQQGETPEARANRLALLTPEERIREEMHETRQTFAREMQVMRFQSADNSDRAAYEAKATVDPLYAKWRPKVEAELAELRAQNMTAPRERIMYYLIGKSAVEGRGAEKGKQRADGARRVQRQQTRPGNSGSDVSSTRRDRNNSLERRLENQSL